MNLFDLFFTNIVQAIAVMSIFSLLVFSYWISKPVWTTKVLVSLSLLVVLSVILQRFGIMIPLFGFPSFRIDFLHLPLIMVGALFGPFFGVVAGIVADLVGLMITPTEYPFFGFMLNKVLMGFIPAMMIIGFKRLSLKNSVRIAHITLLSITGISILYLWFSTSLNMGGQIIELTYQTKLLIIATLLSLMIFLHSRLMKKDVNELRVFALLSTIMVEGVVSLLLTPIWLVTMYQIPVLLSFIVRVIKALFLIPISAVILEALLKSVSRLLRLELFK